MSDNSFAATKTISENDLYINEEQNDGLIVLPEKISESGIGYYSQNSIDLYKELKEIDGRVEYLNREPSNRKYIERRSAPEEYLVDFIIGIASNVGFEIMKRFLVSRRKDKPKGRVEGKVFKYKKGSDGATWEEYKVEGTIDEAIQFIEKIKNQDN